MKMETEWGRLLLLLLPISSKVSPSGEADECMVNRGLLKRSIPQSRMPGEIELRLYRDSLSTPWGFRLHGGKDLSTPLSVQKVTVGTPSDGELQNGDVILQIQGNEASRLTHLQAQEQIRKSGGSLLLRIQRFGAPIRTPRGAAHLPDQQAAPWKPNAQDFGTDYARQPKRPLPIQTQPPLQPGFMLSRVKETLTGVAAGAYGDQYYPSSYERDLTPTRLNLAPAYQPPLYQPEPEQPAWVGSLRSSAQPSDFDKYAGPRPHSPKVQTMHYGTSGEASQYRQRPAQHLPHDSETVNAAHLQYNSPLGLYSKATAHEALKTQLHGKPGEGTLQILSESDVYRAVAQEDGRKGPSAVAAAIHPRPELNTETTAQSPSMLVLESQLAGGSDDVGQSDF